MFLLGMWLCGSVCMSIVATENFYTVDRLLAGSPNRVFHQNVQQLGHAAARDLLRYLSSELNRLFFAIWNAAQLTIGLVTLWLLWRDPSIARRIVLAMLAVTAVMALYIQPQITSLGRSLDFVPREPLPPGMSRFWVLHGTYTTLELLKTAAAALAAWLVSRSVEPVPRQEPERL